MTFVKKSKDSKTIFLHVVYNHLTILLIYFLSLSTSVMCFHCLKFFSSPFFCVKYETGKSSKKLFYRHRKIDFQLFLFSHRSFSLLHRQTLISVWHLWNISSSLLTVDDSFPLWIAAPMSSERSVHFWFFPGTCEREIDVNDNDTAHDFIAIFSPLSRCYQHLFLAPMQKFLPFLWTLWEFVFERLDSRRRS